MQTLAGIGAVVRDARGRYRPGMLLLSLSRGVHEQDLWSRATQGLLDSLACDLDCAVQIGVMNDGMVTYVARGGRPSVGPRITEGMQLEPYCTAIGKTLLAALDRTALDVFLAEGELVALTANTIVAPDALRGALARIRADGSATDRGEMMEGLCCVAAPIRDAEGRVVAAVSASEGAVCYGDARLQHVRRLVVETANAISTRLYPAEGGVGRTNISAHAAGMIPALGACW